ncbi:six-hairpin glycosidase-like protein [Diplodia corticola]|uniref:Six-hairpin glycosidase-like protein n=1 Tax=Diplodia corticola TaxID=236234 RepID=A0A1J9RK82_9PEZI|nr:six-hairpin glycosidase-like protein [Diplodia corticola]OJD28927.1 six-hairpin glycosidase-like protein [Diplodia corticola]
MRLSGPVISSAAIAWAYPVTAEPINRRDVVRNFNPTRNGSASSYDTPMQVGNGDFAFGADVTGLQTVVPWNILSSWCWHNSSLPTTPGQTSPEDFTGLDWWTHGRPINYAQPNPAEAEISQWMIANPHRVNLARIGLALNSKSIEDVDIGGPLQRLDLFNGTLHSTFSIRGSTVSVETLADPASDTLGVKVQSKLLRNESLSVFFDYPYPVDKNKFEKFVGVFNSTSNHTTSLRNGRNSAEIEHNIDATTYFTHIRWDGGASVRRLNASAHRYFLTTQGDSLTFTATFAPRRSHSNSTYAAISASSSDWWSNYWETGAFLDLTTIPDPNATEIQRRTILSQYLLAVNEAGRDPPQESGLANNGWYGKFHMEMVYWHLVHWNLWGKQDLLDRSIGVYERFLPTSLERAAYQGYTGARWGKMSDPTGRSAPGEINSLLIWQQVHPFYFAELEYRQNPGNGTLAKWDPILTASAEWMSSYAFYNKTTGVYDLGPPMYPVSENTNPNATINSIFELSYWEFGLSIAAKWQQRQGKSVPLHWTEVADNLAPLPTANGSYVTYEGAPNMWTDPDLTSDHQGLLAINGVLPPPPNIDLAVFKATVERVYQTWNFSLSYGWDFPLLAMTALRGGDAETAIRWLLDENFAFDDVGMPLGGSRVPTPYFPASGGLMIVVAMLAAGWEGDEGSKWPNSWGDARSEAFESLL